MRLSIKLYGIIFFLCSFASVSKSTELFEQNSSIRAQGMGNAYLGIATDTDAMFYNPAGLAKVSGINWLIADFRFGLNGAEVLKTVNDIQGSSTFDQTVQALYGDHVWVGAGGKTAITLPYFGFAVYDSLDASLDVNNPMYPNLDISAVNDFGYAMGVAIPILPILHVGTVLKYIQRTGARLPFGPSYVSNLDPATIVDNAQNKGKGYAIDLGMNLSLPGPVSPVFSFVWKNAGVTTFTADNLTLAAPPRDLDEMSVGTALNVDLPGFSLRPAFDFKYINRPEIQLGRKIHLGVEIGIPMLDIRAGFSEGYYTWGAGLNLGIIRVDAASYGVELGEYPGQREDRRYAIQFSLELGFDPSLGIFGGGSSSRSGGGKGGGGSGGANARRLKARR